MSHDIETMFYTRTAPWHGLGNRVDYALSSMEALTAAQLDWKVIQKSIKTEDDLIIPNYKANIRETDQRVLGVVTDRYSIVQNHDAFKFTEELFGEGVRYETAGSLQNGKKVWLLAKLPEQYIMLGDRITPYLVFSNSHDGSGSIKAAMTPIRVVCQNTLNLALSQAKRIWTTMHTGDVKNKLSEAKKTLLLAEHYMDKLEAEMETLNRIKLSDKKVLEYIELLFPVPDNATKLREKNVFHLRQDLQIRYFDAPDLTHVNRSGYRFICAVSDFATHAPPLRETATFKENLFNRTIEGNPVIDKAYEMVLSHV